MPSQDPNRTADLPAVSPNPDTTADLTPPGTSEASEPTRLPDSGTAPPAAGVGVVSVPGYELEGVLGRGGMGVVYKARHLTLKRTVALKMILAGGHAGPREVARFRIEAEAVARLQHPNIVQIHDIGQADGHPFCALEFVDGGTLAGRIASHRMPARDAARLVEPLARALQLAHSRNVIHRDLKPANVLLTGDGTPKVTDFGLARQLDTDSGETQAGAVMGTPSYMAPEQAAGRAHEAGPAADVYALGAILYACLTGRPPFKGATVVETLDQVRNREPVPPSRVSPGVPPDLETICLKCLRKEPENRYASAAELADDLVRFQRGEPIQARPVGGPERAWKWVKRNPGWAALIVTGVLVLAGAVVVAETVGNRRERDRADAEQRRLNDLGAENVKLETKNGELDKANVELRNAKAAIELEQDKLRGTVARGWAGTLSDAVLVQEFIDPSKAPGVPKLPFLPEAPLLSDTEINALTELAGNRGQPLADHFMAESVRDALMIRKLRVRSAFAVHAAVGLDATARQKFEQQLVTTLNRPGLSDDSRTDLALVCAELGDLSPAAASAAAEAMLRALPQLLARMNEFEARRETDLLRSLAHGLWAVSSRLDPKDAGRVSAKLATALAQACAKRKSDPFARPKLVQGLAIATVRLDSAGAVEAIAVLLPELAKPGPPEDPKFLAQCLSILAVRLEPRDALPVADTLTKTMAAMKDGSPMLLPELTQGLSSVLARMEPREAARVAGRAAGILHQAMKTTHPNALQFPPLGLAAIAERLEPKDATEIAATLSQAVTKMKDDPNTVPSLARGLLALAPRLEPAAAGEAVAALLPIVGATRDPLSVPPLAQSLAALAARLEPKDAAKSVGVITQALIGMQNPQAAEALADGLSALAARLEPRGAADVATKLAEPVAAVQDSPALPHLSRALSAVAARLEPKDAAALAARLGRAITEMQNAPARLRYLAECLAAVLSRLEPKDAARAATAATAALSRSVSQTGHALSLQFLVHGQIALIGRLEPAEAARVSTETAKSVARAVAKEQNPEFLGPLAECLPALVAKLEPGDAAGTAAALAQALTRTLSPFTMRPLAQGLAAVTGRLEPREASRVSSQAAAGVIRSMATNHPDALRSMADGLAALAARMQPGDAGEVALALLVATGKTREPIVSQQVSASMATLLATARFSDQELVDLLKHPLCVGPSARAVLDSLQSRHGRAFVDRWEFARFAEEKKVGLDLRGSIRALTK